MKKFIILLLTYLICHSLGYTASNGDIESVIKITENLNGLNLNLNDTNAFGIGLKPYDDLDGDGVPEILVGDHLGSRG